MVPEIISVTSNIINPIITEKISKSEIITEIPLGKHIFCSRKFTSGFIKKASIRAIIKGYVKVDM